MLSLEEIRPGQMLDGLAFDAPATVRAVEWIGPDRIQVTFRTDRGLDERVLARHDEQVLRLSTPTAPYSFAGDAQSFRLAAEARRISLAHLFDPYLALTSSAIEPLPHQITAVYGAMMERQPLRFLLADDPGAGKTIMAGLLIKELMLRGNLKRCLIVAPGSLVEQWQDELEEKFAVPFSIVTREMIRASHSGNPFRDHDRLILRLDMAARSEEMMEMIARAPEKDAEDHARRAEAAVRAQVRKSWNHLLVPETDPSNPAKAMLTKITRRQPGDQGVAEAAWQVAVHESCVVEKLGARTLSDRVLELWPRGQDYLAVDAVRDWYAEHLHMDRVRDETVIGDAITEAAAAVADPPFATARGRDGDQFADLQLSKNIHVVFDQGMILVRADVAEKLADSQVSGSATGFSNQPSEPAGTGRPVVPSGQENKPKRYTGAVVLNTSKGPIVAAQIFEAIVTELERARGSQLTVTLEIGAECSAGFDDDVVEVVRDNAGTLGFSHSRFD